LSCLKLTLKDIVDPIFRTIELLANDVTTLHRTHFLKYLKKE